MSRLWRRWVELWDRTEPATALALVRIGASLVLLFDLLNLWRHGLVHALWSRPPDGFALPYEGWASALGLDATALWAILVCALTAVAAGALTRVACVIVALISAQLAHLAPESESAIDMMFRIVFVLLALSRCNAMWSVDAWLARKRGRPMSREVAAWPRYLILAQLVWMYFSGGQNKSGAEWGPAGGFSALANAISDPHSARFDPAWVATVYPVTQLATALTMCFELGAPLYLLAYYYAMTPDRQGRVRRLCNRLHVRWVWLGLGITFEVGIAVTLRLGAFPYGMLALYPALLLPRELSRCGPRSSR